MNLRGRHASHCSLTRVASPGAPPNPQNLWGKVNEPPCHKSCGPSTSWRRPLFVFGGGGGSLGPEFQEGPSEGHLTLVCWSVSVLGDLLKFWKGPPALEKCWRARDAWKYCRQILRNSCGHPNNTCGKNNSRHKQRPTTVSADIMRQSKGNSVVILWTILRTVLRKSCGKSFGEPRGAL